jgi:hypothetical protein
LSTPRLLGGQLGHALPHPRSAALELVSDRLRDRHRLVHVAEHLAGAVEQRLAGERQLDPVRRAPEQLAADELLERPDLPAQGGQGEVELLGRAAEVELRGDRDERAQVAQLDRVGGSREGQYASSVVSHAASIAKPSRPLMPFLHDRDKRLAFPFPARAVDDARMPSNASILWQDADLRLRRGIDVQVTWPPATSETPALLVVLPGASRGAPIWRELCIRIPAVVLAVPTTRFDEARETLEWAADHAAELGADPRRLLLAADHGGAGLVAALARHARDRGWPPISRHVLIDPELGPARVDQLVGLLRHEGRMQ